MALGETIVGKVFKKKALTLLSYSFLRYRQTHPTL